MTLQETSSALEAQSEALVFLSFFADLPDPRQAGKVIYPLQDWRAQRTSSKSHGSARRRSNFFAGSCRLRMGPRRTTSSAIFLR
jgi:hypothetical protein